MDLRHEWPGKPSLSCLSCHGLLTPLRSTLLARVQINTSPTLGQMGQVIYITSTDQMLYALNSWDGSLRWKHFTGSNVSRACVPDKQSMTGRSQLIVATETYVPEAEP